ncbi:TetR/AcrR family transcriptional regulator [Actinomyces johnsonii]|uniref:TetR/AcrR family transcriptional regulator n=1 Tax=Actinomyces johnsonii TaxID=544581 RepID=A0A508A3E8_9ACTO|nr:TetR family transcriptional regulator [Actinomyces johnsonii]KAA8736138.1 TetR/AcrR family transcriptional regulator [Actinomyces johnsonii]TQD42984.1 TetR/AcrR family transcriptional regulator [Actinomyces johnsonii]
MTSKAANAPQPSASPEEETLESARSGRTRHRGPRRHPDPGSMQPSSTREAILTAARESFLAQGYEGTTIRAVARTAGVDPALVSYYFGSKGDLFGAAVNLRVRASEEIAAAVSGDLRSAGPRLVRLSLTAWDDAADGATFRTLLRWMATDVSAPEAIQTYATEQIAVPMAEALKQSGLPEVSARERATLAGSQLVGLAMIRYVLRLDPIASASVEHLVEVVGPTIQHYLTDPLRPR